MYTFSENPKQAKAKINRYENLLKKEKAEHGFYRDGAGKRYLLGVLYVLAGDIEQTMEHFQWFRETFPDDSGDPLQYLFWTLALYRAGEKEKARSKAIQTIFKNPYLVPFITGGDVEEYDVGDADNFNWLSLIQDMDMTLEIAWEDEELKWLESVYREKQVHDLLNEFIQLCVENNKSRLSGEKWQRYLTLREISYRADWEEIV